MRKIKVLSEKLKNQIAAGEVIEGAFSVVKELIENSLDSGASRITVSLEDGGKSQIRVTDNGQGIHPEDLELAITEHATSKIKNIDDLYNITTLGFRGEALSSIASISNFQVKSKIKSLRSGYLITGSAGVISKREKTGISDGTEITISNIFFNTPARRKFLKSNQAQIRAIKDIIIKLSLPHPQVNFSLIQDNKPVLSLPVRTDILERIRDYYGNELADALIEISGAAPYTMIKGYISIPSYHKFNRLNQLSFVNGRTVELKNYQFFISRAYESFLERGHFPVAFLFFEIDTRQIDVNVHPTKKEIRVSNDKALGEAILHSISSKLKDSDYQYLSKLGESAKINYSNFSPADESKTCQKAGPGQSYILPNRIRSDHKNPKTNNIFQNSRPGEKSIFPSLQDEVIFDSGISKLSEPETDKIDDSLLSVYAGNLPGTEEQFRVIGKFADIYLLLEKTSIHEDLEDSISTLILLDFHAAHERVQYERLLNIKKFSSSPPTQKLLVPIVIELTPDEMDMIKELKPILQKNGLEIRYKENNTIEILSLPYFIKEVEIESAIKSTIALKSVADSSDNLTTIENDVLGNKSCKSSITKGYHISLEEARALLSDLFQCQEPFRCPHGRPVLIGFDNQLIDKLFKRIV